MTVTFDQDPDLGFTMKNVAIFHKATSAGKLNYAGLLNLDATHTRVALGVAGTGFNIGGLGGAPTTETVQSTNANKTFAQVSTPNTDPVTFTGPSLEVLDPLLLELLYTNGDTIDKVLPDHSEFVIVAADEAGDLVAVQIPWAFATIDGDVTMDTQGTNAVLKKPVKFTGEFSPSDDAFGWWISLATSA